MSTKFNTDTIENNSIPSSKIDGGAIPEAPNDGKQYARKNKQWDEIQGGSGIEEAPDDGWTYVRYKKGWRRDKYIGEDIPDGVWIGYTDGSYSDYNDIDMTKTIKGVVLKTDNVKICIHPAEYGGAWAATPVVIPNCTVTTQEQVALLDFNGKENTDAIINSGVYGNAFTQLLELGNEWYMPSAGEFNEIKLNAGRINLAMSKIGGIDIDLVNKYYWTSTQYAAEYSWYWFYNTQLWYFYHKLYVTTFRAICAF